MNDHTNEPPKPNTPPEPDNIPQPDEDEVELPPREDRPPVKEGRRPGLRTQPSRHQISPFVGFLFAPVFSHIICTVCKARGLFVRIAQTMLTEKYDETGSETHKPITI